MRAAEPFAVPDHQRPKPGVARPVAPTRRRIDPDRLVGLAFVVALPIALWFW